MRSRRPARGCRGPAAGRRNPRPCGRQDAALVARVGDPAGQPERAEPVERAGNRGLGQLGALGEAAHRMRAFLRVADQEHRELPRGQVRPIAPDQRDEGFPEHPGQRGSVARRQVLGCPAVSVLRAYADFVECQVLLRREQGACAPGARRTRCQADDCIVPPAGGERRPQAADLAMAELRLHNSLTRRRETFVPLDPADVRPISGPPVYDRAHLGNARQWWCSTFGAAAAPAVSRSVTYCATSPTSTTRSTPAPRAAARSSKSPGDDRRFHEDWRAERAAARYGAARDGSIWREMIAHRSSG